MLLFSEGQIVQYLSRFTKMGQTEQHSILYIEDNKANQQLVQFIFEQRDDISLTVAVNGLSGLEVARKLLPDIILLDISLPDITGHEVLEKLKSNETTRNIPVFALSGDTFTASAQSTEHSFDRYLTKPIDIQFLFQVVNETLQI